MVRRTAGLGERYPESSKRRESGERSQVGGRCAVSADFYSAEIKGEWQQSLKTILSVAAGKPPVNANALQTGAAAQESPGSESREPVVFRMGADPGPHKNAIVKHPDSPIVEAQSNMTDSRQGQVDMGMKFHIEVKNIEAKN